MSLRSVSAVDVEDFQARVHSISPNRQLVYRLFVPKAYQAGTRLPLMLTLHGAEERGADNRAQLRYDFNKRWAEDPVQAAQPCFVLAPQCPQGNQWVDTPWGNGTYDQSKVPLSEDLQAVVDVLDSLGREFSLDPARIYVSGISMGGYGTWDLVARYPDRFAAAIPVCGAGDTRKAPALARLPIWAFHAEDDEVVPVSGSRDMIAALRAAGGQPQYVEYPASRKVGHGSWVPAGRHPGLTAWLFAQARPATALRPAGRTTAEGGQGRRVQGHRFLSPGEAGLRREADGLGRFQDGK